ncbi:MAG TPA: efflux RND transporter periplasmic adaptor subunit [Syntrophorhabdaceae bacterium]|nr:efflux RND transporter periplasmic adaptor subunit [Syntrophorhabdaceae bacterium]HQM82730.1 efflux RND transporter periplasmic adaptor subunit [Syntrophorhabdaceae bacterium]
MKEKRLSRVALCVFFTAVCLFLVDGCSKKDDKAPEEKTYNVIVRVSEKQQLRPFIEATGTLNPYEEVNIGAEIDGIIKSVKADEGTAVTKGMLLAAMEDIEYSHEVVRVEALLRQTEATLANTKTEFARKEALFKEQLVTSQQFDDVSTRLAHAESEVERAKAALIIAKQKLAKTKIYAPLTSKVKEKKVSPGDFVKVGTQLFILIQTNPLKVNFAVTEKDVGKIKIGQDVILRVDAFPDSDFKGKVSIVFPSLDEKTRTLKVEALVPNPESMLKPGLFSKVILYTGAAKDTVVVPVTALLYEAEKVKVFTVVGDRAKEVQVKIGSKYGEMMEIIEGIKEGEKIVVAGQQSLSEGVKVNIQQSKVKSE